MPQLINHISDIENLNFAWKNLNKSNIMSYGVSGQTMLDFKGDLKKNLENISSELSNNLYKFSPTRAAIIPKDKKKKKFRPLQIPEIRDRVVIKSIAITLEEELNSQLKKGEGVSFAYQKGLGTKYALLNLKSKFETGYRYLLKADIVDFFTSIDKDQLLNERVFPNLKDSSINKLINQSLSQKIVGIEKIKKLKQRELFSKINFGIPQGNPLSPLLSNVYLSTFDEYMKKRGYSLIRYADDFLVLSRSYREAERIHKAVSIFLYTKLGLRIHNLNSSAIKNKTKILNPSEEYFEFLSIHFDGENLYPTISKISILKKKLRYIFWKFSKDKTICSRVNQVIDYWCSKYTFANIEIFYNELDGFIEKQFYKVLLKQGEITATNGFEKLTQQQKSNYGIKSLNEIVETRRLKQKKKTQ